MKTKSKKPSAPAGTGALSKNNGRTCYTLSVYGFPSVVNRLSEVISNNGGKHGRQR